MTGNAARAWAAGVARGFFVGTADLVPGVSGATVAIVLGIYERLVAAIRGFDLAFAGRLLRLDLPGASRHIDTRFLFPLVAGIALAAVFFTRVVPLADLMVTHRVAVQSFFFGLVAGALGVLVGEARRGRALRWPDVVFAVGGLAAGWGIAVAVPASTPEAAWFVFAAGALAAAAMILPGVSGAYVLVLLKKYAYVLAALGRLDLAVLVPFGLGVAAGLALLSRALGLAPRPAPARDPLRPHGTCRGVAVVDLAVSGGGGRAVRTGMARCVRNGERSPRGGRLGAGGRAPPRLPFPCLIRSRPGPAPVRRPPSAPLRDPVSGCGGR